MSLVELAKTQKSWGIKVGLLNDERIHNSPSFNTIIGDLGTKDVAIFDNESVLLTNAPDGKILSAILTNDSEKLKKAKLFFCKLWDESEKLTG